MIFFITASRLHLFDQTPSLNFSILMDFRANGPFFASLRHHIYLNIPMRSRAKKVEHDAVTLKKGAYHATTPELSIHVITDPRQKKRPITTSKGGLRNALRTLAPSTQQRQQQRKNQ